MTNITLTVAEYNAATRPFAPGDLVTISDTQLNVSTLSAQTIAQMSADNVDIISSQSGFLNLLVPDAVAAYAASNIQFAASNTVSLFLKMAELQALTPAQLSALAAKGLDTIRSSDQTKQIYTVAQFKAVSGVTLYDGDEINVIDAGANIDTLTVAELAKLDKVDATDNRLDLSIAQLNALGFSKVSADDFIIVKDTGANISALSPAEITALTSRVAQLNATDNHVTISAAQYSAMQGALSFSQDDDVTIADTSANFQNFTQFHYDTMNSRGIDTIRATDGDLVLSRTKALALLGTTITLAAAGSVVLADTAASLQTINTQQIADLAAKGVQKFDVTDANLTLSVQQAAALAATPISFMAGDTITITGSEAQFADLLNAPEIAALAAKGVSLFDSTDDAMTLNLAEFNALGQISLSSNDLNIVVESRAVLEALSVQELAKFATKGIDFIRTWESDVAFTVAQFKALGATGVLGTDTLTLKDTGANLSTLSVTEIIALAGQGVDKLNATDNQLKLSVEQLLNLGPVTLSADDNVIVTDLASNIKGLTAAQITALGDKGLKQIDATDTNIIDLDAGQVVALAAKSITALDTIRLLDTQANIEALTAAQIASFRGGIAIDVSDTNALTLRADQAVALTNTAALLTAADNVTLADTSANIQALTAAQINAIGNKRVDVIDVTGDNKLTLAADQAKALAGSNIMLTAADDVTVSVTVAGLQTLTGAEITALLAKGVDRIAVSNPNNEVLHLTLSQLNALSGVDLSAVQTIILSDTGASLAALTPAQIADLASKGIDSLDVSNDIAVLNLAQLKALGSLTFGANDVVTLLDTSAALTDLTQADIASLATKGVDKINALDDEWTLTFDQAVMLADKNISFSPVDSLVVKGTGEELGSLSTTQIAALAAKGIDTLDASNNNITLSAAQLNALGAMGLSADDAITILGTAAADRVTGRASSETFFGFAGNDVLNGGGGNDMLDGGYGNDVLTGGGGNDTFVFRDRLSKAGNVDKITDYNKSFDSILLDNKYMPKLGREGHLSASAFVIGTKATKASQHLIYDKAHGNLYYDADGSGHAAQVLIAQFTNKAALTYSEFTII